jgi:hypothetical protein
MYSGRNQMKKNSAVLGHAEFMPPLAGNHALTRRINEVIISNLKEKVNSIFIINNVKVLKGFCKNKRKSLKIYKMQNKY